MNKTYLFSTIVLIIGGCTLMPLTDVKLSPQITYKVDLTNHMDDIFHVTVLTNNLSANNNIYNFAATAPGTYQVMNFGRYVKSFKAYDKNNIEIKTKRISTNQWKIKTVNKLSKIVYDIVDSFDAENDSVFIYPMSGTGIQDDFIAFNTFGVLGYFEGLQSQPIKYKIDYKSGWTIGTALDLDSNGYYFAESYDRLADSPVLIGNLTMASTKVNDIDVDVFVYALDSTLVADSVLAIANDVLQSAGEFIGYSPVPYYKFLMVLLDNETMDSLKIRGGGALEHSYSSLYFIPFTDEARRYMGHEFMHILTPLNLHSEIIQSYNFAIPTASEHIWLYEGVTEWITYIMQLRSGLITTKEYLQVLSNKLRINDRFNPEISLREMSIDVYDSKVSQEFLNFYNRGAVTAAMLDIRLLELSNGTKGLREIYLELLNKYGKNKPFPEEYFFNIIVEMTYPEIKQFINDYLKKSKLLPYKEYMSKLGFQYFAENPSEDKRPAFGIGGMNLNEDGEYVITRANKTQQFEIKDNDVLVKLFGKNVTQKTFMSLRDSAYAMNVGDEYKMIIRRNEEEIEIVGLLLQRMDRHIFKEMEIVSDEQKFLRDRWSRNL